MKKGLFSIAILLIAVTSLFAQSAAPTLSVDFPAIAVNSNTVTAPDSIVILADQIAQQQYTIDTYKIHSQSDRVAFYGLQRQLAQTRQTYYSLLASVSPDKASECRQTAWKFKRDADQYAQKQYASIESDNVSPTPVGRLRYDNQ